MRDTVATLARPVPESSGDLGNDPSPAMDLPGLIGDFCHLLRNRLNSLQMGLYIARRGTIPADREVWDELDRHYREAERVLDLFQTICRPIPLTPIPIDLEMVLKEFHSRWATRFEERGARIEIIIDDSDGPSRLDPSRLVKGLDSLASWRIEDAGRGVRLTLVGRVRQGTSRVEWIERGSKRIDGAGGLPLATLASVAAAHGGTLKREDRDGWRVLVQWPHHELNVSP